MTWVVISSDSVLEHSVCRPTHIERRHSGFESGGNTTVEDSSVYNGSMILRRVLAAEGGKDLGGR